MKKILLAILLLPVLKINAQGTGNEMHDKNYYLKKSKRQNTTAWALIIPGTVAAGIGFLAYGVEKSLDGTTNEAGLITGIAGSGLIVTSIVLFKASAKNKRMAMSMSFNINQTPVLSAQGIANKPQPSFGIRLRF